ncbi:efflux RND transporter periplasmic adaptor subunit [Gemmata sp. G18]|uniref:Efflux RND transporter periplasmic adaptor subunit n=1 Tax=Gemmata palustris TaxID=2822762 RepID=A0ABS5BM59_9BACT|nr:efflux RND transporter periplasmic adaptor subunit [Gemmata palustris]MBP3954776.1 efflux RND transporter periplasmic adaptor subunit [Gemmata palustris]
MRDAFRSAILLGFAALSGCAKLPHGKGEQPPAPVTVATAGKKTVPIRVRTIGTVKVVSTVAIRARVGGPLTGVFFKEGDSVKENQKLFTIDPAPYEAAVRQAETNMAKSTALLNGAELDLARAEKSRKSGVGSDVDYDSALTAASSARAAVEADRAAINTAKLQASFTTITSPLDGRVGELLVNRGNLVDANGVSPLVVINQISPIYVAFTLPEQQLPVVTEARKKGPLRVEADLRSGGALAVGELAFIDNTTDPLTGTIQFKAAFENADQKLWPGLFVDVVLTLGDRADSVVVPSAALQSGQKGLYVYVVTPDNKAEMKPVVVAFEVGGEAVIASGLSGGEAVVVEGQLRLAPGARVDPKPAPGLAGAAPAVPALVIEGAK